MRRSSSRWPSGVLGAVLCLAVAACGGGGEGDEDAPSRQFLSMGTAPPGGAFFVVGSALAEVVNETGGDLGYNVTAEATSGSQENIRRLGERRARLRPVERRDHLLRGARQRGLGPRLPGPLDHDAGPQRGAVRHASRLRHHEHRRPARPARQRRTGRGRLRVLRRPAARGARRHLRRFLAAQRHAAGRRRHADRRLRRRDVPGRRGADRVDHPGRRLDGAHLHPVRG